jgi:zinc protease
VAKVETAFREELARALKDGFTNAEVASAQTGIVSAGCWSLAGRGAAA